MGTGFSKADGTRVVALEIGVIQAFDQRVQRQAFVVRAWRSFASHQSIVPLTPLRGPSGQSTIFRGAPDQPFPASGKKG